MVSKCGNVCGPRSSIDGSLFSTSAEYHDHAGSFGGGAAVCPDPVGSITVHCLLCEQLVAAVVSSDASFDEDIYV